MKKLLTLVIVAVAASSIGGCSILRKKKAPTPARAAVAAPAKPVANTPAVPPLRVGVSSVTVEQMAREQGCVGGQGAGLVGETGPVEVYRMQCADGKVFTARCELRQCKKM